MKIFDKVAFVVFSFLIGLSACRGKDGSQGIQGPAGPAGIVGPGATQYIYTGNFPSPISSYEDYVVHIPEMTIESDFLVSTSSNAVTWDFTSAFFDVNPSTKDLVFHIGPFQAGNYYRVTVKNYP